MAGQTDISITSSTDVASDDPWNNWYLVGADDGSYAYTSLTGSWDFCWGFNFNIPYQAKITGCEILIEKQHTPECSVAKQGAQSVQVTNDRNLTAYSAAKTFTTSGSWVVVTLGDSGDLWGLQGWNAKNMNDGASLQVLVTSSIAGTWSCTYGYTQQIRIDYIAARLHYTMPDSPHPFQTIARGTMLSPGG
jgi:hypothetical protein